MNSNIDIVLPWVDDSDPNWITQKNKYASVQGDEAEESNIRFQSWDNLHLWFRAIEKCLPWVHKIFLVTWHQRPGFLVEDHPKVVIVDHEDYIPREYLPTFNSNTIEMNLHRIPGLSENFILFNDDVFPLQLMEEGYFFMNDMVCDEAVENIITTGSFTKGLKWQRYSQVNNMFLINKYFNKREIQKRRPEQWFCRDYGNRLERTMACKYWNDFPGFYDNHLANAFRKSTFATLWEKEPDVLHQGSLNKFRGYSDVSQYLARYWQLCEGNFHPRRTEGKVFFPTTATCDEVACAIDDGVYPIISFNENCTSDEFPIIREKINSALQRRFPRKSSFEK